MGDDEYQLRRMALCRGFAGSSAIVHIDALELPEGLEGDEDE